MNHNPLILSGKDVSLNVYENLLRLKVPTVAEEQNAIWDMTADLSGINDLIPLLTTNYYSL